MRQADNVAPDLAEARHAIHKKHRLAMLGASEKGHAQV